MASLLENMNASILAIPAYHFLSLLPHAFSAIYVTNGRVSTWDNRNPRSEATKSAIAKRVDAKKYAAYERLEAAHANSMENMPLFVAAVVLGNMAGLHKVDGSGGLNWFVSGFLVVRVAYAVVYFLNDTQKKSYPRTWLYFLGVGMCWRVLFKAALTLV